MSGGTVAALVLAIASAIGTGIGGAFVKGMRQEIASLIESAHDHAPTMLASGQLVAGEPSPPGAPVAAPAGRTDTGSL